VSALAEMINSQADAIARMAAVDIGTATRTLADASRILLVGTGTSQHAAELGAFALTRAGRDARWLSSSMAARWSAAPRPGDAMVLITHTAQTALALRTRAAAQAARVPLVSIVGADRPVDWPEAVRTVPPERSETYTVSYTAAVVLLARLSVALGGPDQDFAGTAEAVRALCDSPSTDHIAMPARSLALIGAGPWAITAREGALKIREAARVLAQGFEAEQFLHGFAVPMTAADGLVLVQPTADPDGLVAALGVAAAATGLQVSTIEVGRELGPVVGQIPATVTLQLLADRFAAIRGQNPDEAITGAWASPSLWRLGTP
jgi:glucosamine--fructose-6-phosphate aminotransferase (isomerizing)